MVDQLLTVRQRAIIEYLQRCDAQRQSPTVREIADACGISSTGMVGYHLARLVEYGLITREAEKARGIRLNPMLVSPDPRNAALDAARSAGERLYFLDDPPIAAGTLVSVTLSDPASSVRVGHVLREPYDVYIGRTMPRYGLARSIWANPFRVGRGVDAREACKRYAVYLLAQDALYEQLPTLVGKTLGCWCKKQGDEPCHGDVLVELLVQQGLIEPLIPPGHLL